MALLKVEPRTTGDYTVKWGNLELGCIQPKDKTFVTTLPNGQVVQTKTLREVTRTWQEHIDANKLPTQPKAVASSTAPRVASPTQRTNLGGAIPIYKPYVEERIGTIQPIVYRLRLAKDDLYYIESLRGDGTIEQLEEAIGYSEARLVIMDMATTAGVYVVAQKRSEAIHAILQSQPVDVDAVVRLIRER